MVARGVKDFLFLNKKGSNGPFSFSYVQFLGVEEANVEANKPYT